VAAQPALPCARRVRRLFSAASQQRAFGSRDRTRADHAALVFIASSPCIQYGIEVANTAAARGAFHKPGLRGSGTEAETEVCAAEAMPRRVATLTLIHLLAWRIAAPRTTGLFSPRIAVVA
jgi:hypothetical protein